MLGYQLGLYLPKADGLDHWGFLSIALPFWLPAAIIGLATAFLLYRDRRRIRPGCCRSCGYDLTGNVSGICPECGTAVAEDQKRQEKMVQEEHFRPSERHS
jgi:hypothetical protein